MIDKEKVRTLYKAGVDGGMLAREFNVSRQRIHQIVKDLVHTIVRPRKEYICKHCNLPFHSSEGNIYNLKCSDCSKREQIERKKYWNFRHRLLCCPQCQGTKFKYSKGVCSNCNLKNKYKNPGAFREHRLAYARDYGKEHAQQRREATSAWHKRLRQDPERYRMFLLKSRENYQRKKQDPIWRKKMSDYWRDYRARHKK